MVVGQTGINYAIIHASYATLNVRSGRSNTKQVKWMVMYIVLGLNVRSGRSNTKQVKWMVMYIVLGVSVLLLFLLFVDEIVFWKSGIFIFLFLLPTTCM